MSKSKSAFFCNNCGYEAAKWAGKCPACNEWNTFTEELVEKTKETNSDWEGYHTNQKGNQAISLNEVDSQSEKRIDSSDVELNRVLGGGIILYYLRCVFFDMFFFGLTFDTFMVFVS